MSSSPENKTPILMCEGVCRRPSRHVFKDGRPVRIDLHSITQGTKFYFECATCQTERVWGFDSVP